LETGSALAGPQDNPDGAEADLLRAAEVDPARRDPSTSAGARHHEDLRQVRAARLAVLAERLESYAPPTGLSIPLGDRAGSVPVYVPPPADLATEVVDLRHTVLDMSAATARRLQAAHDRGDELSVGDVSLWNQVLADHAAQARALDGYNL